MGVRKALLAGTVTALSLALCGALAPAASALELSGGEEEAMSHCADISQDGHEFVGGCRIRVVSDAPVELRGLFGIMISCNFDLEAAFDEQGAGYMYDQVLSGSGCAWTPCSADGELSPWPVALSGSAEPYSMEVDLCWVSSVMGTWTCHLAGWSVTFPDPATVAFAVDNGAGSHRFCEGSAIWGVLGSWTATADESHPPLEVD